MADNPTAEFERLKAPQNASNAHAGPRTLPARTIPVPDHVDPATRALAAAPYRAPQWDADPGSPDAWRVLVKRSADQALPLLRQARAELGVSLTHDAIGGVGCYTLAPAELPAAHRDHVVLAIHGGGYVFNPGESGTGEAALLAAYAGFRVIAIDYRMPPDAPYPAAIDDVMSVYRAVLTERDASNVAVCGSSAGGALTLALVQRARDEGLPLPAAIATGTPAADMSEVGDTLHTHEWLDNVLVSWRGYILPAAKMYAGDLSMQDPRVSPVYGDFNGLPPAILISGTRDLFLSNTVRTHRKLREAGIEADLHVFESLSHVQYLMNASAPVTKEVFGEIGTFFDRHLRPRDTFSAEMT